MARGGGTITPMAIECDPKMGQTEAANKTEEKRRVVKAELGRAKQLPSNSSYAIHRVRVLNKLLQLLSISQRTVSQDEELELLFATLSL